MKESIEWIPTGYLMRDITRSFVIKPGFSEPFDPVSNAIFIGKEIEKVKEPIPDYNIYDLHDNLLGSSNTMEEAIQIFKERYKYWDGDVDLFIDETDKPLRIPLEPLDFKTLISLYNKTFYNLQSQ